MIPKGRRDVCYDIFYSTIAQLVERLTVNQNVTGSIPVGGVCFNLANVQNRYLTLKVQEDGAICAATITNIRRIPSVSVSSLIF